MQPLRNKSCPAALASWRQRPVLHSSLDVLNYIFYVENDYIYIYIYIYSGIVFVLWDELGRI